MSPARRDLCLSDCLFSLSLGLYACILAEAVMYVKNTQHIHSQIFITYLMDCIIWSPLLSLPLPTVCSWVSHFMCSFEIQLSIVPTHLRRQ